jgi:hypothetical protein
MSALKQDPELKVILAELEHVKTARTFKRWKNSFLTRWEEFLEQENFVSADSAYKDFAASMGLLVKLINTVNDHIEKGELTFDRTTVRARNSLNEMSKILTMVIDEEDALIPQTNALEKKRGYNKFHMGAVLVRDNFGEYGRLTQCRDILQHMRSQSLGSVADKQILEEMDNYTVKLQKFCDVMADMGLFGTCRQMDVCLHICISFSASIAPFLLVLPFHCIRLLLRTEVMLKCREFDVEDDGPNLENLIFIDIKTLGLGELSREICLLQKVLTERGADENGNETFAEAPTDEDAKAKLLKIIEDHPKLGFGSGKANNTYDRDEVGISEFEKVQNMWGVKLKKTPKNVKGEELIFVDQKSGAFGELSRRSCLERDLLSEVKDEQSGKIGLAQAFQDFEDRAELMERIRMLLKLGVDKN